MELRLFTAYMYSSACWYYRVKIGNNANRKKRKKKVEKKNTEGGTRKARKASDTGRHTRKSKPWNFHTSVLTSPTKEGSVRCVADSSSSKRDGSTLRGHEWGGRGDG